MLKKLLSCVVAAACFSSAIADEASVAKALSSKGMPVNKVTKTDTLGLYEVFTGDRILYVDEKVSVLIDGNIIDVKAKKNLTQERLRKLTAIKFSDLPISQAIKLVRGDGKRVMATFEDPNCGYCKRLVREFVKMDNVTVYTFLLPILGDDSLKKAKQIWCTADPAKAWTEWMVEGKHPGSKEDCDISALNKNVEFAGKLGISGTPTMFFANGERISGALPPAQIEQRLNEAASK